MTRDALVTTATRLVIVAAGVTTSILTARTLGPSGRGDFFFVVTLSASIVQFGSLGFHGSNTYLAARGESSAAKLTINSAWIAVVIGGGGGILTALALTASGLFADMPQRFVWYAIALAVPTLFFLLGTNLLLGLGRIAAFNAVEVGSRAIVVVAIAVAAVAALRVDGFLVASILGWLAACALLGNLLLRGSPRRLAFDRSTFEAGVRFALRVYAVAVLAFLVLRGAVFLLRYFDTAHDVGQFSIAAQIAEILAILPSSIALVLFPALVRERNSSWSTAVRTCAVTSIVLAVACGITALLARPGIEFLFGTDFRPAVTILYWLLPGVLAIGATTVLSQYLAAQGLPGVLIAAWAFGLGLLLALGSVLVPRYGGEGAAASVSITYAAVLVMVIAIALDRRGAEVRSHSLIVPPDSIGTP